jgi:2-oxoglutarate ferredoxin oxidoreductase subunit delta
VGGQLLTRPLREEKMSAEHSHQRETKYVRLETRLCQACWKCLEACPLQVLRKIDIGWHRHIRIRNADACNGCKKCVRACDSGALTYIHMPRSTSDPGSQGFLKV